MGTRTVRAGTSTEHESCSAKRCCGMELSCAIVPPGPCLLLAQRLAPLAHRPGGHQH
ncbi:hypothetical protein Pla163_27590 [Planctomycetes bacterium Pla163]|uniref:Uncharacterized protein n=1 Tax=Rohdeia mirabilis TaxID=2528008 RepID=A0A518D2D9_9BACT|nr:hypothetical protein Pla163_27590 [Planctomycetes bacterium Pla163]